jgi:hypothetical protein
VVAPISTSSLGRVIRRPSLYKDTRRQYLDFFFFLLVLSDAIVCIIFSVELTFLYCGPFTPFFYYLPFSVLLVFVSGRLPSLFCESLWRELPEGIRTMEGGQ